jgi:hypothetical protein
MHRYILTYTYIIRFEKVRERKNKWDDFTHENHDDHEGLGEADLKEHEELTKV